MTARDYWKFRSLKKIAASSLCVAVLAGCVSPQYGPSTSSAFPSLVTDSIPCSDGEVQLFGPGSWYPNTKGFTEYRDWSDFELPEARKGVVALTGNALVFVQWNNRSMVYEPIKRVTYSGIKEVGLDSYGRSRMIVIQHKDDYSFDSFSIETRTGRFSDATASEQAVRLIARKLSQND